MMKTRIKPFLSLVFAAILLLTSFASAATAASDNKGGQSKKSTIQSYVEAMQPGWNLGNTLDATGEDETSWGNPRVTQELINHIAAEGYNSIRIPITWDQRLGAAPDYTINPDFMNRVEEIVNWALEADLYVMINLHHDSWMWVNRMQQEHDQVLARYNAAWTQISDRFRNHSNKLMFESINEPRFTDGWGAEDPVHFELLEELNVSFYHIVRSSGGKNSERPLVLPTLETATAQHNLDALYETITELNDPNLIATVHYYGFWPFSVNIAGYTRFEEDTRSDITATFDRVHDTLVARGIPVVLGEFGLLGFDKNTNVIEQGEKLKFFEFLIHYLQQKNITHMLWDNGQHLNRSILKWNDPELFAMMKASWKGRSSTAETDQIFLKQGDKFKDVQVQLQLNGNKLTGLSVDGKKLRKGKEYELNGEVLTLKSCLLCTLTSKGKQTGKQAEIIAHFNKGADWRFNVITYNTPVLKDAVGTTNEFSIPTAFNGDRLATMEAVYEAGGNAGPQNWTSYKEFGNTFNPSYDTNEISLLPAFFNEVQDGKVILTFHFWSGEKITYTITKNGMNVTGQAS
ncbi:cellulase family glycosylhydrolase [Paenibacillus tarimensis]|uniref:cellulase family glycosylhydrolase n=1 Tax=Paenibacillus tarimensis TaxID=416012 RepID=UPI001F229357|nr:cellulase family glycosylhydrolase [Paenibacillus tarimensis]MCF2946388.1 cellulase family glycosylhydrolase [Paenibacillus tarimensis]